MKKSTVAPALLGLLALGAALAFGLLPQSETYSDDGYGMFGVVDVNCGSALSPTTDVDFQDYAEGEAYRAESSYSYEPPIFEGQTATEVCDEKLSGSRTTALVALGIGAILLVVAAVRSGNNKKAPPEPFAYGATPPPPPASAAPSSPPPSGQVPPQPAARRADPGQAPPPRAMAPTLTPASQSSVSPEPWPIAPSVKTYVVSFSDGRLFGLEVPLVIGRAPFKPETYDQAAAVTVDDMTVSKTHLAVGQTGGDVWIEDLQSRNGVSVWSPAGTETQIVPGRRAILDGGDRVIVGDETSFTIKAPS